MQNNSNKYYPTTAEAIHLLVLYIVLQSLIDFPLALFDYYKDTNWLSNAWISFFSSVSITGFIFYFGFRNAKTTVKNVFALNGFNLFILIPIIILLPSLQYLVGWLNGLVEMVLPAPNWFWELFEKIFDNHFGFWGTALKVVLIAPIVEEILFRGIIMYGLMRNYRSWYAIFLSGILFSLFHLNPWQMTYTFFLGLLLGWLMVKTRSLPLTIIVHALNNLIVLLSITFQNKISSFEFMQWPTYVHFIISTLSIIIAIIVISLLTRSKKRNKKIQMPSFKF